MDAQEPGCAASKNLTPHGHLSKLMKLPNVAESPQGPVHSRCGAVQSGRLSAVLDSCRHFLPSQPELEEAQTNETTKTQLTAKSYGNGDKGDPV